MTKWLLFGDQVTMGTTTKQWTGSAWEVVGVVINGNMLVDGSVAARKINTNGLEIRDNAGNLILGSGVPIPASYLTNTRVNITPSSITTMVTVNGQPMKVSDFVNTLSRINATSIGTFMDAAAIGNAYIGNAAVSTLKIQGNAVTIPMAANGRYEATVYMTVEEPTQVVLIGTFTQGDGRDRQPWTLHANYNSSPGYTDIPIAGTLGAISIVGTIPAGTTALGILTPYKAGDARCGIVALGVRR